MAQREAKATCDLAGRSFSQQTLILQELEKMAVKRTHERIQWRVEREGGRVMKDLENRQSEEAGKVDHRGTIRPREGHHEMVGQVFKAFGPQNNPEAG
jgi:hypothetical protein